MHQTLNDKFLNSILLPILGIEMNIILTVVVIILPVLLVVSVYYIYKIITEA